MKSFYLASFACSICLLTVSPFAAATPDQAEWNAIAAATTELDSRYQRDTILSVEQAESASLETNALQVRLQSWYSRSERACRELFFVNDCLADIKRLRRTQTLVLNRVSIEAKALQRKLHIQQLDQDLQQKQMK